MNIWSSQRQRVVLPFSMMFVAADGTEDKRRDKRETECQPKHEFKRGSLGWTCHRRLVGPTTSCLTRPTNNRAFKFEDGRVVVA